MAPVHTLAPLRSFTRTLILRYGWVLILAAPSLWLLSVSPIFWRGTDSFHQVSGEVNYLTVLHWPPLYNFAARIPLWLGAWLDALFHGASGPGADFFARPAFSDASLFTLVVCQHFLLVASLAGLVAAAAGRYSWRWAVAALFALNSEFYIFAQTIGSETLGIILVIAFLAMGLRVFRNPRPTHGMWIASTLILAMAILTRHINAVIAALLPLAFLARLGLQLALSSAPGRLEVLRAFPRPFGMALLSGVLAIGMAQMTIHAVCLAAGIEYRSRVGYTFQWRLVSLQKIEPGIRRQYLEAVAARASDPMVKAVILELENQPARKWDVGFIEKTVLRKLEEGGASPKSIRTISDRTLNEIARTFLTSPDGMLLRLAAADIKEGLSWTPTSTGHNTLLDHNRVVAYVEKKPQLRPRAPASALQYPLKADGVDRMQQVYMHFWDWCPVWGLLLAASSIYVTSLILRRHSFNVLTSASFSFSLLATGFLLYVLNTLLTFNGYRFQLPMIVMVMLALAMAILSWLERPVRINGLCKG